MRGWIWLATFLAGCTDDVDRVPRVPDPVVTPPAPDDECNALGLPKLAFSPGPYGEERLDVADDFTIATVDGPWTFSAEFEGCDSYLFVPSEQAGDGGLDEPLWSRDGDELLATLPKNTHVFFISTASDDATVDADIAVIQKTMKQALRKLSDDDAAWWEDRLHYAKRGVGDLQGSWVGRYLEEPGYGFGIDRAQRIRDIGSLADADRYSNARGWFEPNLGHVGLEAVRYDFEAVRDARLAADVALAIRPFAAQVIDDSGWAGVKGYNYLELPDAATMAGFDTLELDFTLGCPGEGENGVCPDWDRIVNLYLCDESDPDICDTEVGRWISAYHREGRWVTDASFLLPLLADGGQRRLALYSIDPYAMTLDVRLSDQEKPLRPVKTEAIWQVSRPMDDYYLPAFPATDVVIPANAEKVELSVIISGHGMSSGLNCAEFCDTHHLFAVNGQPWDVSFPETANALDCQESVDEGVVPNQWGTWFYGRSNWCPGQAVIPLVQDVTALVTPGDVATLTYDATGPNGPLPGGEATMVVTAYLTIYARD